MTLWYTCIDIHYIHIYKEISTYGYTNYRFLKEDININNTCDPTPTCTHLLKIKTHFNSDMTWVHLPPEPCVGSMKPFHQQLSRPTPSPTITPFDSRMGTAYAI